MGNIINTSGLNSSPINDPDQSMRSLQRTLNDLTSVSGSKRLLAATDTFQASMSSANTSTERYEAVYNLLDTIHEIDPDILESINDDLKQFRKKNKKSNIADFLALKSQFFTYETQNNTLGTSNSSKVSSSLSGASFMSSLPKLFASNLMIQDQVASISNMIAGDSCYLMSELSAEEIEEIIEELLSDGIDNIDELETILKLLGALGMSADQHLIMQITEEIQEFLESESNKIADPLAMLQLLEVVKQFLNQQSDQLSSDHLLDDLLSPSLRALPSFNQKGLSPLESSPSPSFPPPLIQPIQTSSSLSQPTYSKDPSMNSSYIEESLAGNSASAQRKGTDQSTPPLSSIDSEEIKQVNEAEFDPNHQSKKTPSTTGLKPSDTSENSLTDDQLKPLYNSLDKLIEQQTRSPEELATHIMKLVLEGFLNKQLNS